MTLGIAALGELALGEHPSGAGSASASVSAAWSIRNTASSSYSSAWSIRENEQGSASAAWSITRTQTGSYSAAWSIQGESTALGSYSSSWSIKSTQTGSASAQWTIRANQPGGSASAAWSVRNSATGSYSGAWSIEQATIAFGSYSAAWSVEDGRQALGGGGWPARAREFAERYRKNKRRQEEEAREEAQEVKETKEKKLSGKKARKAKILDEVASSVESRNALAEILSPRVEPAIGVELDLVGNIAPVVQEVPQAVVAFDAAPVISDIGGLYAQAIGAAQEEAEVKIIAEQLIAYFAGDPFIDKIPLAIKFNIKIKKYESSVI